MNDRTPSAHKHVPDMLTQGDLHEFLDLDQEYAKVRRRLLRMRHRIIQRLSGGADIEPGALTALVGEPYEHPWDALRELTAGDWDRLAKLVSGEFAEHLQAKANRPGRPFLLVGLRENPSDPGSVEAL